MDETVTAAVADDHACAHCGYNLRGLKSDGKCPECFTPVSHSLRGDLLKYADPDWLDRLRFGTKLKLWNVVIGLVVGVSAVVIVFSGFPRVLLALLALVGGGIGAWASFVITTQEPRIALNEDPLTWRKAIRTCAVLSFIGETLSEATQAGQLGGVLLIAAHLLSLARLVTLFGELVYFRRFALRVPDDQLARSTRIVMWGSLICMTFFIIAGVLAGTLAAVPPGVGSGATTAPGPVTAPVWVTVIGATACVAAIPTLVFFLWYIRLLGNYKDVFTQAATESRGLAEAELNPGHGESRPIASDVGRMESD